MFSLLIKSFFLISQVNSQICKVKDLLSNLLPIPQGDLYNLNLNDYFIGEGLTYRLDESFDYFQINQMYGPTSNKQNIIDMTSYNLNFNPQNDQFAYFALIEIEQNEMKQNVIYKSELDSIQNKYQFSTQFSKPIPNNCQKINQFRQYLLITCLNLAISSLEFQFYDSLDKMKEPEILQFSIDTKLTPQQIIIKTSEDYICVLILDDNNKENELYIFFIIDDKNLSFEKLKLKFQNILYFEVLENFLFLIERQKKGITYYNLKSQDDYKIIFSQFNEQFIGIKLSGLGNTIFQHYLFVIWGEQKLISFLCNSKFFQQNNIQQIKLFREYNDFTQISEENNLLTNVFINFHYIIISNIEGISIYPSIFNEVNQGLLLYYYPIQSYMNSFDYINNVLLSVQKEGLFTYIIQNPVLKLSNTQKLTQIQQITLYAQSNKYGLPGQKCSIELFFQTTFNPTLQKSDQISQTFLSIDENYSKLFQQEILNINKLWQGSGIEVVQFEITNHNTQQQYMMEIPKMLKTEKIDYEKIVDLQQIFTFDGSTTPNDQKQYYFKIQLLEFMMTLSKCDVFKSECKVIIIKKLKFEFRIQNRPFAFSQHNEQIYIGYMGQYTDLFQKKPIYEFQIISYDYHELDDTVSRERTFGFQFKGIGQEKKVYFNFESNYLFISYTNIKDKIEIESRLIVAKIDSLVMSKQQTKENFMTFFQQDLIFSKIMYNFKELGNYLFLIKNENHIKKIQKKEIMIVLTLSKNSITYLGQIEYVFQNQVQNIDLQIAFTFYGVYLYFPSVSRKINLFFYEWQEMRLILQRLQQKRKPVQISFYSYQQLPTYGMIEIKQVLFTNNFMYLLASYKLNQITKQAIYVYQKSNSNINCLYYAIKNQINDIYDDFFVATGKHYDILNFQTSVKPTSYQIGYLKIKQELNIQNLEIFADKKFDSYEVHITLISENQGTENQERKFIIPFNFNNHEDLIE